MTWGVRTAWVGLAATAGLVLSTGVARAHDVTGSRFDAPVPLSALLVGAGATVALTALWLAVSDRSPSPRGGERVVATVGARPARAASVLLAAVFLAGVLAALADGLTGRGVAAANLATVFAWPVWFRGLALVAVLVGSPWPVLSPWRTAYRALCRVEGGAVAAFDYPTRLGSWPALVGFVLLVGVVENLTVVPRSPRLTTAVVACYGLWVAGGAVLFGPAWLDRADPLGVLYRLFGRVAPVATTRTETGAVAVAVRPPWQDTRRPVSGIALVAFVVAAVYTVSFDGFTETRTYQAVLFGVRDALGTGPPTSVPIYLAGLAAFVGVFVGTTRLCDLLGSMAGEERGVTADGGTGARAGAALAFAPTVLPIAAAYDVAHNYPYVTRSTARLAELVLAVPPLDPLGALSLPAYWGSQVVLVVVGHAFAVVAAHRVALDRYPSAAAARRAHLPLVVLMVGYTVLSLWIVSRPVVG